VRGADVFAWALAPRVRDRIGAVGGTLTVDAGGIHAELPCAW
jgi:hypothetical protein